MAENGVESQHDEDVHHVTRKDDCILKPGLSNGNPFMESSGKFHEDKEPFLSSPNETSEQVKNQNEAEMPLSGEVLIDLEIKGTETGGGEGRKEEREVKPDPSIQVETGLLDDFDPLQQPCSGKDNLRTGNVDLLGMMDRRCTSGSEGVEVSAVPPSGRSEVNEVEENLEATELNATDEKEQLRLTEDETAPSGDAGESKKAEVTNDTKAGGEKTIISKSDGSKTSDHKDSVSMKTTETKGSMQVKSPRPGSTSRAERSRTLGTKTTEDAKSKTQSKTPGTAPKSAIPSIESPRETTRSASSKGHKASECGDLTNSKAGSQPGAVQSTKWEPSKSSAAEQPASKSPSPGSTPRSSVSASADGRANPPEVKNVKSKIGSLDNTKHSPGGGNVRIQSQKMDLTNVTSRCGSKDNMSHVAGGGQKKIESRKLEWKVESKVGSLDNTKHKPGGGDKKIDSKKLEWNAASRVGSLENAQHKPGGGDKKIETVKLDFKDKSKVQSKVGSKDNIEHKPGGGSKKIENQKLNYEETATSKIGSLSQTKAEGSATVEDPAQN